MARVRRKTSARARWNLEIAGIAALGFALLLGIALVAPPARTGAAGGATAFALHAMFGLAAGPFVMLIALVAAIVFLEINVPKMIATLGGAACAYFVLIDAAVAASGHDGGMLGGGLYGALHALVGDAGVWVVLLVAVLAITVAITGVSLKKVIGWCVTRLAALFREHGVDVVHTHNPHALVYGAPAGKLANLPAPKHDNKTTPKKRFGWPKKRTSRLKLP